MANIEWLWNLSPVDSGWSAVSLTAVLAFGALVGVTYYLSRARAEQRWLAALDAAYAKLEQTRLTP